MNVPNRVSATFSDEMVNGMRTVSVFVVLLAASLASKPAWADNIGPPLSAAEINQMIIGNIVTGVMPDGATHRGIYNQDGSFSYGDGTTGTWRIDGDKFCATAAGSNEVCGTLHKLSDKKFEFIRPDGSKGIITVK